MAVVFFASVFFIAYTYFLYPLIITIWGSAFPKRVSKRYEQAPVSVVLAVRDEEGHITERIENLLAQDYPAELIEIVVVSDNSTDQTVALARAVDDERVSVYELEDGSGKASALNLGVARASHDLIVFADARQRFSENSLAELVAMFNDDKVGGVSGELIIRSGTSEVGEGVGLYWRYEKLIRRMESEVDSVVGATGSIYAIRRHLFVPMPENTLLDDFLVPMRIVLAGYRVIFVRSAKAFDWASADSRQEFRRKVRTLAGNYQAFAIEPDLLNPARNRIFFQTVSHKITRLLAPYFVIAALVSNMFLHGTFFHVTLALQFLFYSAVLLRFTPLSTARFGGLVRIAWTFVVLNAAAVMGLYVYLSGKDKLVWKKTS